MEYPINKGVGKPIEFHGIRAQYLVYMVIGAVALLLLFALLYLIGISLYVVLPIVGILATVLFSTIGRYSKKYGVHGLTRQAGYKSLPKAIKTRAVSALSKRP